MSAVKHSEKWFVYIIETPRGQYYCGTTNNLKRRLEQHRTGKGSKYLKRNGVKCMVWSAAAPDRSEACKCETHIQGLPKKHKRVIVNCEMDVSDIMNGYYR